VDVWARRGLRKGLNDVYRRTGLRIPAAEIDERLALLRSGGRDAREQSGEVLLG
jgi:hypothetical protein